MRTRSFLKYAFLPLHLAFLGVVVTATPVFAQSPQPWGGVCISTSDASVATLQGFQCLLANVLSSFLSLVGIVGFIMIAVAGIRLLLSGGNSQAMEKSRSSVTFAILGIVLALSSFIILNLISEFTGIKTILNFVIPTSDTNW